MSGRPISICTLIKNFNINIYKNGDNYMGNYINYGEQNGDVYMADHDMNFYNSGGDLNSIKELLSSMMELVEKNAGTIDKEQKESIIEDIHTIEEQTSLDKPSEFKLKKAISGLICVGNIISKCTSWGNIFLGNIQELQSKFMDIFNIRL